MDRQKFRVVIAGGGTAGWVAAAALVRHLGPNLDITLVESDAIGTVGVGESTIPTAWTFHKLLGINEQVFLRETNATFKLGIAFENWLREGDRYFHPFGSIGRALPLCDFQHFWLEAKARGFGGALGDYSLETQAALAGKFMTGDPMPLAYAYHLDATAYAAFLRRLAEPAGVRRVEGRITQVEQTDTGDIAALVLEDERRIEGDLFIDCTGFRALLIEETLKTGFDDWSHWLPTDRAFAVQSETTEAPVPYTRAIAHGAGWRWRIPLQHRMGNGFVYASGYLSDDVAREQLLAAVPGRPLFDPRLIRFTTGMRKKAWNRNCIALGLASGFIEPLESTSIHLVMIAVTRLLQNFPTDGGDMAALSARFNAQSRAESEHIRDFIILHYKLNDRPEPFWRDHAARAVPDSLAARIALFREGASAYQEGTDLFRVDSWNAVLLGQGVQPRAHHPMPAQIPSADLERALGDLRAGIAAQLARLPGHADFIAGYAAAKVPAAA
jgi:tryptophan halogenase